MASLIYSSTDNENRPKNQRFPSCNGYCQGKRADKSQERIDSIYRNAMVIKCNVRNVKDVYNCSQTEWEKHEKLLLFTKCTNCK